VVPLDSNPAEPMCDTIRQPVCFAKRQPTPLVDEKRELIVGLAFCLSAQYAALMLRTH
jgi:hypothetical protein